MAECCEEEDEDGFIPYERKYTYMLMKQREEGLRDGTVRQCDGAV